MEELDLNSERSKGEFANFYELLKEIEIDS